MIGYVKAVLTVLAAGLGGFSVGLTLAGRMAGPWLAFTEPPLWVAKAELLMYVATIGAAVCVLAWVYVDHRYGVKA